MPLIHRLQADSAAAIAWSLALAVALVVAAAAECAAQALTIERVVELPSGLAAPGSQPIAPGADWYDQPLTAEGAARLRVVSSEPTVAVLLRFDPLPREPDSALAAQVGALELRIILFTAPDPLEYRQFQSSQTIVEGKLIPAREHWAERAVMTELAGEPGRVARIVVQDDHGSALRWRQQDDLLVLEAIPPEAGGRPVGALEPWYAQRLLKFIDYRLMGGGYLENALGDLYILDFLAARFNGFFTTNDTHFLGRLVLRTQVWRNEFIAAWAEGGGAFWQKRRANNSVDDEDLTWVLGGTGVYRSGDWGGSAHAAYVNGPLVMELLGGWQMTRRIGLFVGWQNFDGSSGFVGGLGLDF